MNNLEKQMHLEVVGIRELLTTDNYKEPLIYFLSTNLGKKAASSIETLSRAKARFGGEMSRA